MATITRSSIELASTNSSSSSTSKSSHLPPLKLPPIGQFPPPLTKLESNWKLFGIPLFPWFLKQGNQIVRFDIAGLLNFRAIITMHKTFLLERKTWNNMGILFVLAVAASLMVVFSRSAKSIDESASEDGSVGNTQALMGFVMSGYVTLVVMRWDTLRNTTLGVLWGDLENLVVFGLYISDSKRDDVRVAALREDLLRYVRLVLRLTFGAARNIDNLTDIQKQGLLKDNELEYLQATLLGTRPLMGVMWLWRVFDKMQEAGVVVTDEGKVLVQNCVDGARGGIGATLGMIGCPFPYSYAHIMHWIVQIYIWVLAVDTGVGFGIQYFRTGNGEGSYASDDRQHYTFPTDAFVWLSNNYMQQIAGNVVYILFAQGLLKTMLKLYNPFNDENTSFPEMAYDAFIHNNCRAMSMGLSQFDVMCTYNEREATVGPSGFDGSEDVYEPPSQILQPMEMDRFGDTCRL